MRWAAYYALEHMDLDINIPGIHVVWRGTSGMTLREFPAKLLGYVNGTGPDNWPKWVLVHLGTNDLVHSPIHAIQGYIWRASESLRNLIPGVQVVWSEILQRREYKGACNPRKLETARKTVNRKARQCMGECGGRVIQHTGINWQNSALYSLDGVHLSNEGYVKFINDLREGMALFTLYPSFFKYPFN